MTNAGDALVDQVVIMARALQAQGVAVSAADVADALRAAAEVDLGQRPQLRTALLTTLVKAPRHYGVFDAVFDRLFPASELSTPTADHAPPTREETAAALIAGDQLPALADAIVADRAGLEGELRSEGHHLQRALRAIDLARLMTEARALDPSLSAAELNERIDQLKRLLLTRIRGALGDHGLAEEMASIENIEFLTASRAELNHMREVVAPMARRIATRVARRRQQATTGRVHMRQTVRHAVGTGGVPFDLRLTRPRVRRPELFVLCDVSGSVAEFSMFTLTLMSALSSELASTRSFIFVDAIDEVTSLLNDTDHGIEPWQLLRNTRVIGRDGHSDYGTVLEEFWDRWGREELRRTSTVLITGDARSNHRDARPEVLERIADRCAAVYWLNPDPEAEWDTGDSDFASYRRVARDVHEVRSPAQLAAAIEQIF